MDDDGWAVSFCADVEHIPMVLVSVEKEICLHEIAIVTRLKINAQWLQCIRTHTKK